MDPVKAIGDNPDWTAGIADRKIQDAMEQGMFDNLPGAGQPLDLTPNPVEMPGMGAINRLMKHNKALPPWLMLEQEIAATRSQVEMLLSNWEAEAQSLSRIDSHYPEERGRVRARYQDLMRATNDLILKYNYSHPFVHRTLIPYMTKTRLAEFDEQYAVPKSTV